VISFVHPPEEQVSPNEFCNGLFIDGPQPWPRSGSIKDSEQEEQVPAPRRQFEELPPRIVFKLKEWSKTTNLHMKLLRAS
jgi:hypothetical protein